MIKNSISEVVTIRFGLYMTTNENEVEDSESADQVAYLQVRQFDENGKLLTPINDFLPLDNKSAPHLLNDGDVLFVGKGNRLFAWCYRESYGPAIASSIFFVLRPDKSKIYPEYLAAILNAPQTKSVFQQIGAGTSIFSIRKSELGAFQISLLPLEIQKKIVRLERFHTNEMELYRDIIKQKESLYKTVLSKLINGSIKNVKNEQKNHPKRDK